jgi:hypothetical protein
VGEQFMEIIFVEHKEIDREKYDNCIVNAEHGTVYAMSWYLDAIHPGWELLIAEDYRYVMPLPVKQKYGLKYLIQPFFSQQLGVFSMQNITPEAFENFLKAIPYRLYFLQFNSGNILNNQDVDIRINFVLPLDKPYADIQKNYKKNFARNLRKAENENFRIENNTDLDVFLDVIRKNTEGRPINYLTDTFRNVVTRIRQNTGIEIWSVKNIHGELLSSALFVYWKNRVYYLLPVSTREGKQKQSMSFLLDKFIETSANKGLILDFEGSSIPNIARYYESTGASAEHYPVLCKPKILFKLIAVVRKKIR